MSSKKEALERKIEEINDYVTRVTIEANRLNSGASSISIKVPRFFTDPIDDVIREKYETKLLKADIMSRFATRLAAKLECIDVPSLRRNYGPKEQMQELLDSAINDCQNGYSYYDANGSEKRMPSSMHKKPTFEETKKALTDGPTSRVDSLIKEVSEIYMQPSQRFTNSKTNSK